MFDTPRQTNRRSRIALLASFLVHGVVIYVWLNRAAIFVQPSAVAWGLHGTSDSLIYFPSGSEKSKNSAKKLHYRAKRKTRPITQPAEPLLESRAGLPSGSLSRGPAIGTEATPALPLIFPDPEIHPSQLNGLQGDVIVEVTIDEKGNVTETRILQSLQQEIDQKVIATLKGWRFKPASVDGTAISSRQDVHFHFPG